MEWLDGDDLSQLLLRGPLRLTDTLRLISLVADALATTHRHGVVHRDRTKKHKVCLRYRDISHTATSGGMHSGPRYPV
jgi:hypothetical protein